MSSRKAAAEPACATKAISRIQNRFRRSAEPIGKPSRLRARLSCALRDGTAHRCAGTEVTASVTARITRVVRQPNSEFVQPSRGYTR